MTTLRIAVSLAITIGLSGCTDGPKATTTAATAAATRTAVCAVGQQDNGDGMLQVAKVWPKSSSDFHGYQLTKFDQAACSNNADLTRPAPADCDGHFPWIADSTDQADAILGSAGVTYLRQAVVSGDEPVPAGQTIYPREIRETVLTMRHSAVDNPVAKAGQFCGTPMAGFSYPAYRLSLHSDDTNTEITGILIVAKGTIIWLEFDQPGWTDQSRLRAAKFALNARPFL